MMLDSCSAIFQRNLRNNAYISPQHRLLCVATPKVACTGLKWWFGDLVGMRAAIENAGSSMESDPELDIHDTFDRVAPQYTGANEVGLREALTAPDYFRFCVVRNPFTRVFSAWQSKWLLSEPLQAATYPDANIHREFESAEDIREAFEDFLQIVASVEDVSNQDVHVAPQWELLNPLQIAYSVVGQIENPSALVMALGKHLGPSFRDPFSGRHSNVSLLPYSAFWVSDNAAKLIRSIYAKDFELFGYDTAVPAGGDALSDSALPLALRCIRMLRGRNTRIGELIGRFSELAKANTAMSTMQMFWSEGQNDLQTLYLEDRSTITPYAITSIQQSIQLFFPNLTSRIVSIRLDLSNQPAAVVVHSLSIETADGQVIWQWSGEGCLFQNEQGAVFRQVRSGILAICLNNDPQCSVIIPEQILACISGGSCLKIEITAQPLLDVCADVLSQDDRLISDLRRVAQGKSTVNVGDLGGQTQASVKAVTKGLEEVVQLIEKSSAKRNQIMDDQAIAINSMRDELLRAEAQLDLLKDVMLDRLGKD